MLRIDSEDILWREESGRMVSAMDVYVAEKTTDGQVSFQQSWINARLLPEQMETARLRSLPLRRSWKPGVNTTGIRALVRNAGTGRLGTLDIPILREGK